MVVPKDYGTPERRTYSDFDQVPRSRSYQRDDRRNDRDPIYRDREPIHRDRDAASSRCDPSSQQQMHRYNSTGTLMTERDRNLMDVVKSWWSTSTPRRDYQSPARNTGRPPSHPRSSPHPARTSARRPENSPRAPPTIHEERYRNVEHSRHTSDRYDIHIQNLDQGVTRYGGDPRDKHIIRKNKTRFPILHELFGFAVEQVTCPQNQFFFVAISGLGIYCVMSWKKQQARIEDLQQTIESNWLLSCPQLFVDMYHSVKNNIDSADGEAVPDKVAAIVKPITKKIAGAGREMLSAAWRDFQSINGEAKWGPGTHVNG